MVRYAVVVALMACVGCAEVQSHSVVETVPASKLVKRSTVEGSRRVTAQATVRGTSIDLIVKEAERCSIVTTHRVRKLRHTRRTLAPGANWGPAMSYVTAALLVGVGTYMMVDAEGLAAQSAETSQDPTTAGEFQAFGGFTIAGGAFMAGIGIADSVRLSDSTHDLGEISLASDRQETECHGGVLADQPIRVRFRESDILSKTDSAGLASISMLGVKEADLPSATSDIFVHVGRDRVPLVLEASAAASLLAALEESGRSRVSRDRAESARMLCERLFASLTSARVDNSTGAEQLTALDSGWARLERDCPANDHEAAKTRYLEAAQGARRAIADSECEAAIVATRGLLDSDLDAAETQLEVARQACSSSSAGARSVVALERELETRVEAERAYQAAAGARSEIVSALGESDPGRARALLRASPAAARGLTAEQGFESLLFENLDSAFLGALRGDRLDKERLCHGRKLFTQVYGEKRWRAIVRSMAERGDDPFAAARRIKVLKSNGCR
jgi:hypothetical protein